MGGSGSEARSRQVPASRAGWPCAFVRSFRECSFSSRNAVFLLGKQLFFSERSFYSWKTVFRPGKQFSFLESSFFSGKAVFLFGKQFFFLESSVFSRKAVFRFGNALFFKECAVLGLYVCGVTIISCGSKINVYDNQRVVNFLRFFSTRSKIPAPDLRSNGAKGSPVSVA